MKLSATTLGCPEWTLEDVLRHFPEYGYAGVELRGLGTFLDLPTAPGFSTAVERQARARQFNEAGLTVSAIDSSTRLSDFEPSNRLENLDLGKASIDLAQDLGAPVVRVFGGSMAEGISRPDGVARVAENLQILGEYAAANGDVVVALETHDSFSLGRQVAEVLARVTHPRVVALWDLHHPFRNGEQPEDTLAAIGHRVGMTHVKDSQPGGTYCLLGEGDVPIRHMLRLLRSIGYDGWVSLEWEKRWIHKLLAPEIAFPQYARVLSAWLTEDGALDDATYSSQSQIP